MASKSEILEAEFQERLKQTFLEETSFLIDDLEETVLGLEAKEARESLLSRIFRSLHSIKGSAASVGFVCLSGFAHVLEDYLSEIRANPSLVDPDVISILLESVDTLRKRHVELSNGTKDSEFWDVDELKYRLLKLASQHKSISDPNHPEYSQAFGIFDEMPEHPSEDLHKEVALRGTGSDDHLETNSSKPKDKENKSGAQVLKIDSARVEDVLQLVGQLVILKGQVEQDVGTGIQLARSSAFSGLEKVIRDLYDKALSMRMNSMKQLFMKMQRIVRDTSARLNKPIAFEMSGEDTEMDRSIIEQMGDPLTHLIRNAIDHGIENSDLRRSRAKSEQGKVQLRAYRRSGMVIIEVADDGGGIHRDKVIDRAIKRSLISKETAAKLTPSQVHDLLFLPGFSTAEAVTDLSGRGVGLDVVRSNVENMKGLIEIDSTYEKGTTFRISLPLTAAIMSGVVVAVHGKRFIFPTEVVAEFLTIREESVKPYGSRGQLLEIRGDYVPLLSLASLMEFKSEGNGTVALLIEQKDLRIGIIVDRVIGIHQVVLKGIGEVASSKLLAGAAILSDGYVAPVIDVSVFSNTLSLSA